MPNDKSDASIKINAISCSELNFSNLNQIIDTIEIPMNLWTIQPIRRELRFHWKTILRILTLSIRWTLRNWLIEFK